MHACQLALERVIERRNEVAVARALFAMVGHRLADTGSKRACAGRLAPDAWTPRARGLTALQLYGVVDFRDATPEDLEVARDQPRRTLVDRASVVDFDLCLDRADTTNCRLDSSNPGRDPLQASRARLRMNRHDPDELSRKYRELARVISRSTAFSSAIVGPGDYLVVEVAGSGALNRFKLAIRERGVFVLLRVDFVYQASGVDTLLQCASAVAERVRLGLSPIDQDLLARFRLSHVASWLTDELCESLGVYRSCGWRSLEGDELDRGFRVCDDSIRLDRSRSPFVVFDTSSAYSEMNSEENDVTEKMLHCVCACRPACEEWFVHDIGANVVALSPLRLLGRPYLRKYWMYPVLARGDDADWRHRVGHTTFVSADGKSGFTSSLTSDRFTVFGADMIDLVARHRPSAFREIAT